MLIVAALNLPYTAVFAPNSEEGFAAPEAPKQNGQKQSLLKRNDSDSQEQKPDLPFDFVNEESLDVHAHNPAAPAKPKQMPPRSIVDERVRIERLEPTDPRRQMSVPKSPAMTSGTVSPNHHARSHRNSLESRAHRNSTDQRDREVRSLRSQMRPTSIFAGLTGVSPGDYDAILERERMDRIRGAHGLPTRSTTSLSSLPGASSSSSSSRRRKGSVASFISEEGSSAYLNRQFSVEKNPGANNGLFNALDGARNLALIPDYKSVGLPGFPTDALPQQTKWDVSNRLAHEKNCHAVYVTDSEREGHYDIYSKEFLWPTFHCQIPDIPTSKAYEEHSWGDYVSVNQAIADKIVEVYEIGDTVFVNDYHLMLVPQMVRSKLPTAPIGFFMHVAFPSSEVFRCLAYRSDLLSGLLAANLIGFHIQEFAQHFKMTLARILAVDITAPGVVETADHDAFVLACPLGIDPFRLDRILDVNNPESAVQQHRKVIRERWPFHKIISARDKLDPIRGLPQKFKAFDQFLSENPQWASKVVLVQILTSATELDAFADSGLEAQVDQINSKYGDIASGVQPVVLLKQDIKYEQYLALLAESDGFCVSCLRDGMNLTCHEYVYCNDSSRMGPLILSEFTGSASVFGEEALLINPWNQDGMIQAFKSCVEMPRWEREQRWSNLRGKVLSHQSYQWAEQLTRNIERAWEDELSRECIKASTGEAYRIYHSVQENEKRLFFLEVEEPTTTEALNFIERKGGRVPVRKSTPSEDLSKTPSEKLLTSATSLRGSYYATRLPVVIRDLCSDPRNIVYVMSAESPDYMERIYRFQPGIGLLAEFGKFIRVHNSDDWAELDDHYNEDDWQEEMKPLLGLLRDRSLVFDFSVHDSSIIVEFNLTHENADEQRDLSTIGEYMSLINDQYSRKHGVRSKLEGTRLTIYKNTLGFLRRRAYQHVLKDIEGNLGMLMVANVPFSTEADDVVFDWAEGLQESGRTRELITAIMRKHPSRARCMVEGTNALLTLLQTMRQGAEDGAKSHKRHHT